MHELGITQEIVAIAAARAGDARVTRVVVEIGRGTAVLPDAVRFCFDVCAEGTSVEGAALDIVEIPARVRCRSCGGEQELFELWYTCPCGAGVLEWLSGEELRVRTVEMGVS
jgi:hydrogenase nickel incorporation protein HypA/HybF